MPSADNIHHLRPVPRADGPNDDLEAVLIARARGGDGRAWARLYQRHFDTVYRDLYYQLGNAGVAEELVQETFAQALVGLPRFDGRSSLVTWLRGIGQNLVRKHWRGDTRRDRAYTRLADDPQSVPGSELDPEQSHLRTQRARVLEDALQTLPPSLREVFVMRDVQGLSVPEVAERLSISEGNVRVRANRARAKIRNELTRLGWLEAAT
ncbi:MAG: RNA polymerase sigma factor [Nannocystaceae bacterium]